MPKARNKGKVGASAEFITQDNETQTLKHSNQNREAKIGKVEWCGKPARLDKNSIWKQMALQIKNIRHKLD